MAFPEWKKNSRRIWKIPLCEELHSLKSAGGCGRERAFGGCMGDKTAKGGHSYSSLSVSSGTEANLCLGLPSWAGFGDPFSEGPHCLETPRREPAPHFPFAQGPTDPVAGPAPSSGGHAAEEKWGPRSCLPSCADHTLLTLALATISL